MAKIACRRGVMGRGENGMSEATWRYRIEISFSRLASRLSTSSSA